MALEFFLPMIPPTTTQQMHRVSAKNGKPVFYSSPELKAAEAKLSDAVGRYRPKAPISCGVRLITKWCFPVSGKHKNGEYKTSRPDTDNLQKLLKDVMTKNKFWLDDAQVASEICEKFWADIPGIYIYVQELERV